MNKYMKENYTVAWAKAIIKLLFNSFSGKKVLELGCGGGFYSLTVAEKGGTDILLMDIEPVCVKAARLNLKKKNLNVDGFVGDCTQLPLRARQFDEVICIDVIEHIYGDDKLLKEVYRILKENGFFIVATQNSSSLNGLIEGLIQRRIFKREWVGWDPNHVRLYSSTGLGKLLNDHNFEIIKTTGTYFVPYKLSEIFERFSKKLFLLIELFLEKLDTILEYWCDKTVINKKGWGLAHLCRKRT